MQGTLSDGINPVKNRLADNKASGAIMKRNISSLTWILIISFALQFSLISFTFPISELLSGKPFLHVDSPYHQYQIYMTEQLGKQGLLRGYDPFFAAGYVG